MYGDPHSLSIKITDAVASTVDEIDAVAEEAA
jgi:hypothetical protein